MHNSKIGVMHHDLSRAVDEIPQYSMANAAKQLPYWLNQAGDMGDELADVVERLGVERGLAFNLHYELAGGGCVSAAVPYRSQYRWYRKLEWSCGFAPQFEFKQLTGVNWAKAMVRHTPGYVGALSGFTDEWHVSMNMAPGFWDPAGMPASWVLREAIASGRSFVNTQHWLLQQRVIRPVYLLLATRRHAVWLYLGAGKSGKATENQLLAQAQCPVPLIVGNAAVQSTMDRVNPKAKSGPYQAGKSSGLTLDDAGELPAWAAGLPMDAFIDFTLDDYMV